MSGGATLTEPLRGLVAAHEQQTRDEEDRRAAAGWERLRTIDRDPGALSKARAQRAAADLEVKKAAARMADAQAAYAQAQMREDHLSYELSSALVAARRAAVSPWRYARARARIADAFDAFRLNPEAWATGGAGRVLSAALTAMNAFPSGDADPPADIDAWADDVFAEFNRQFTADRAAYETARATAAATERQRLILS